MEKKDILFELVLALQEGPNHVRALAKDLDTNHSTVSRRLHALQKRNVVNWRIDSRAKVFVLKDTGEAGCFVRMAEYYRLLRLIEEHKHLRWIVGRIQSDPRVRLALLVGDYARGRARKDSDIELFIETVDKRMKRSITSLDPRIKLTLEHYERDAPLPELDRGRVILKGVERFYERKPIPREEDD